MCGTKKYKSCDIDMIYPLDSRSHWDCHRLPIVLQNVKASAKRTSCRCSKFFLWIAILIAKIWHELQALNWSGWKRHFMIASKFVFGLQISSRNLGSRHSTDWWQVWPSDPPCVTYVVCDGQFTRISWGLTLKDLNTDCETLCRTWCYK